MLVVGRTALLVVDRHDDAAVTLEQVGLGHQTERRRRQHHRAGDERPLIARARGRPPSAVDDSVGVVALHRVEVVGEPGLHPLDEEQPRAVRELVHHPRGHEIGNG
jgi:hypothetical protein